MQSLPLEAFVSHECLGDDLHLYHVYDALSQTPLHAEGISCGDPNTYLMGAQHIIIYDKMAKHLDWKNREPTYFISFYASRAAAWAEAQRRRSHRNVGGRSRQPDSVRAATVSAQTLDHAKIFYFF
jgi:hypothetical protein